MRRITGLHFGQIVVVVILMAIIAFSASSSWAGALRQEVPRLDGYQIYFTEDNKEASPFDRSVDGVSRLAGLLQSLGAEIHTLDWRRDVPAEADLVIIVGPTKALGDDQSARLWAYLRSGGSLLLLTDPLTHSTSDEGNIIVEANKAFKSGKGLFVLTWADYGVRARDDVVVRNVRDENLIIDFMAGRIDATHPITTGLEGDIAFFGARSIEYDASVQNFETTPLLFSDDAFYGEMAYIDFLQVGEVQFDAGIDTPYEFLALAVAAEDPVAGTRLVIIGDREFATNGGGLQTSPPNSAGFLYRGNVQFLLQSVAWLVGADPSSTAQLTFPTPGPTATPLPLSTPVPITSTPVVEE